MPVEHFVMSVTVGCIKGKKGKVVPVLFLAEHHAMEAYWGVEV
jgi:hypothetical protein